MPKPITLLGFDFGMKRIGVAIGQTLTQSANPIAVLDAKDGVPNWETIQTLIQAWGADAFVVGIPYNMDGSAQATTNAAKKFAKKLQQRFGLVVYTLDERLTTLESKRQLAEEYRTTGTKMPEQVDSYAAKLILEQWLRNIDEK